MVSAVTLKEFSCFSLWFKSRMQLCAHIICTFTWHPTSILISLVCVTFTQMLSTAFEVKVGLIQKSIPDFTKWWHVVRLKFLFLLFTTCPRIFRAFSLIRVIGLAKSSQRMLCLQFFLYSVFLFDNGVLVVIWTTVSTTFRLHRMLYSGTSI